MKKKFDLKTSKVKGICFHRTRQNWIGISLFTGELQIWDFRNGFKIAEFKENDACLRSADFHPLQSLVVAGGDDFAIRGYDYAEHKRAFELKGHVDFIRTVQFHHELPWVLSCSDDQTIRVWNWQSKSQLSVITGHGHYVMCARFHPARDLIASGSLDSTLRLWDFSRLKSRFSSAHGAVFMLSNDVEQCVVAEAHTKGINWLDFHPSEDALVTCSDDRLVKLWKFSTSGAYEQQAFHGHANNVSCAVFTRDGRGVVSNSEDNSLRLWDLSGLSLAKQAFGEEKQWALAVHPELPLVASGGDKSLSILSLMSERVQYDVRGNVLVYFSMADRTLKAFELASGVCIALAFPPVVEGTRDRDRGERLKAQFLALNPFSSGAGCSGAICLKRASERECFVFSGTMGGAFAGSPLKMKKAVFVGPDRFAALLEGGLVRLFKLQGLAPLAELASGIVPEDLLQGEAERLFMRLGERLVYWDCAQNAPLFSLEDEDFKEAKQVVWNRQRSLFAVVTRFGVHLFDKGGHRRASKREEARVKSAVFSSNGVLFYNTHEHIKYALRDGEVGLVRSIDKIVFLGFSLPNKLVVFDVGENFEELQLDTSEIEFKNALAKKSVAEVKRLLREKHFLGKSMVGFLLAKKYNSIAMQLTKDSETAFFLALHSGNLSRAFELASELGHREKFELLADAAVQCGDPGLAESALQLSQNVDRLLSLCTLTGDGRGLKRLAFSDPVRRFNKTLFSGDARERVKILSESGQLALAYATARSFGLQDFVNTLEKAYPELRSQVLLKKPPGLLAPPRPLAGEKGGLGRVLDSWPLSEPRDEVGLGEEGVLLAEEEEEGSLESEEPGQPAFSLAQAAKKQGQVDRPLSGLSEPKKPLGALSQPMSLVPEVDVDQDEAKQAWGVDNEFDEAVLAADDEGPEGQEAGQTGFFEEESPVTALVKKSSALSWEHFAVGDIDGGLKLLRTQAGLKSSAAIKGMIIEFSAFGEALKNTAAQNAELLNPFTKQLDFSIPNKYAFDFFKARYDQMMQLVTKAKLPEALELAKEALLPILFAKVGSVGEAELLDRMKLRLLHYTVALRAKIANDAATEPRRKVELVLIMALCALEPAHRLLILQLVLNALMKAENYLHALFVIRRFLKVGEENPAVAKEESMAKMRQLLPKCQQKGKNAVDFGFKEKYLYEEQALGRVDFEELRFLPIDDGSLTEMVVCPFDQSAYELGRKGEVCGFCETCEIGFEAVYSVAQMFGKGVSK